MSLNDIPSFLLLVFGFGSVLSLWFFGRAQGRDDIRREWASWYVENIFHPLPPPPPKYPRLPDEVYRKTMVDGA